MLKGAMTQLRVGRPDVLETDVGPVISLAAKAAIEAHVAGMAARNFPVFAVPAPGGGFFVGPTVIEIPSIDVMGPEIFGPVLHIVRYKRAELDDVIRAVNALGYGLTFGIHSRIEETIRHVCDRIIAGNIYVNRNIIGAVVGSQPFGGSRLSGTGPKAGGPLLLRRLLAERPAATGLPAGRAPAAYAQFLEACAGLGLSLPPLVTPVNADIALPGPVGETNIYRLLPRGRVLCRAGTLAALCAQAAAALATGNVAVLDSPAAAQLQAALPAGGGRSVIAAAPGTVVDAALYDGDAAGLLDCMAEMAALTHALVPVFVAGKDGTYPLETLVTEQCVTTNTAAAGGNASLMTIG
jgi:RHH-type proline utilization regulon transcriptional repressor/proline dehydrogenase/delta 1-pyrroline-5-carboxylate dehydrogenase